MLRPTFGGRGVGLDRWRLVVGGFLNLEGTFMVLSPSLASPSLPRWGENRLAGGRRFWAWLVVGWLLSLEGTFMVLSPSLALPSP